LSPQPFSSGSPSNRPALQSLCAIEAILAGFTLLSYAVYFVPNELAGSPSPILGFLLFLGIVGAVSIVSAIGYWTNKTWAWPVHLVSALGQLFLPGSLFEFKLDLYHMIPWGISGLSLIMVIIMGFAVLRKRRIS
jgi:uncharacterized membrane protein (DUF2068 family)